MKRKKFIASLLVLSLAIVLITSLVLGTEPEDSFAAEIAEYEAAMAEEEEEAMEDDDNADDDNGLHRFAVVVDGPVTQLTEPSPVPGSSGSFPAGGGDVYSIKHDRKIGTMGFWVDNKSPIDFFKDIEDGGPGDFICNGVFKLQEGNIYYKQNQVWVAETDEPPMDPTGYMEAFSCGGIIAGGTGRYKNARGTVTCRGAMDVAHVPTSQIDPSSQLSKIFGPMMLVPARWDKMFVMFDIQGLED